MKEEIKLVPIKDLGKKKFSIPNYQRGYRWDKQQVIDLLEDIAEFMNSPVEERDDFYCLQPLVVREAVADGFVNALPKASENALQKTKNAIEEYSEWEVIDGQQRLTTIHMILSFLGLSQESTPQFDIYYATREDSREFLEGVANKTEEEAERNVDFWHMKAAYAAIKEWFENAEGSHRIDKAKFSKILLNDVKFIWYESSEDPVKVFTRLNIGKIALTNSELVKALFLNKSNFADDDDARIRLRQIEIASRWDQIEATLQDDEFWMFLHEPGFDKPTRIDFILDLVCEFDNLKLNGQIDRSFGNDEYRTFRYFYAYFKLMGKEGKCVSTRESRIETCWERVDEIFATFMEWFDDLRFYHYVGFLVVQGMGIAEIYSKWQECKTKDEFLDCLISEIKKKIEKCRDLNKQYEIGDDRTSKTQCRPLLLLHNIQTVINQNGRSNADGCSGIFYKFPFHLYKMEGWDIEHIDSNSTNQMGDNKTKVEYLANVYLAVSEALQKDIDEFINSKTNGELGDINDLKGKIECELGSVGDKDLLNESEKNMIWNFTLLDSHTNRSYSNAIFPAKRRIIIGKDKGQYIPVPRLTKEGNGFEISKEGDEAPSPFIPPCTRQVFLKYYSTVATSPNYWTQTDAKNYRDDIFNTLKNFGVYKEEIKEQVAKGE